MVLNYIWIGFFLIAFLVAIIRFICYAFRETFGLDSYVTIADRDIFQTIIENIGDSAEIAVSISLGLIGVMTLWMGIMKIGENGGAVNLFAKLLNPFFQQIFPEVPKNHPAHGSIVMNFSANMLGLDNAATPLGLKAMKELQSINPSKTTASNAQIMFLVLNTSGLTLIPVSILALRTDLFNKAGIDGSAAEVFLPILLATFCSSLIGLMATCFVQKINIWNKTFFGYVGGAAGIIGLIFGYFSYLRNLDLPDNVKSQMISTHSSIIGNFILIGIIMFFLILAIRKNINVYDSFIEGAKDGFQTCVKIIPYLVAMLVAIGVFRASGALEYLFIGIKQFALLFTKSVEWVETLPVAFMKPLSGSGARGAFVEISGHHGVGSFVEKMAATMQGSTETTFYVLAVYFGSVNIKNTRNAATLGLLADFAGIIAAIVLSYFFYQVM